MVCPNRPIGCTACKCVCVCVWRVACVYVCVSVLVCACFDMLCIDVLVSACAIFTPWWWRRSLRAPTASCCSALSVANLLLLALLLGLQLGMVANSDDHDLVGHLAYVLAFLSIFRSVLMATFQSHVH